MGFTFGFHFWVCILGLHYLLSPFTLKTKPKLTNHDQGGGFRKWVSFLGFRGRPTLISKPIFRKSETRHGFQAKPNMGFERDVPRGRDIARHASLRPSHVPRGAHHARRQRRRDETHFGFHFWVSLLGSVVSIFDADGAIRVRESSNSLRQCIKIIFITYILKVCKNRRV